MSLINAFDTITVLSSAVALSLIIVGWKRIAGRDIKVFLIALYLSTLFYGFCLWIEWHGIS